ncbi:peptidoglycan-binding protein [Phormidium tenue FACHB-886]|nr:peptidoglycan-binding protein [Phormidium tenue FACHB-886]
MSDPSTLLLLTCVTCTDLPDSPSQTGSVCTQPQGQNQSDETSASPCVSPPESIRSLDSTPNASAVRFTAARAAEEGTAYIEIAPRPAPPERFTQMPAAENRPESRPATGPLLRFGNQSKAVSQLQERLRQLGYYKGALDGVYGNLTVKAVSEFQRAEGLGVDGIVGQSTWNRLQQPRSSTEPKKRPRTPPANTAPPTQKRETPSRQNASPKPSIPVPQPTTSPEQRPAEQPSPGQPSPAAQPSPAQPSLERPAEPPSFTSADDADLGRAYFWVSGWAIVYIGGFVFIYRSSNKRKVIRNARASQRKPSQAVVQTHPAQPVQQPENADGMVDGNAPPFSSRPISHNSAQPAKMGAPRQAPLHHSRKLNSPPQFYVTSLEDFSRGINPSTVKNSPKSSTNARVPQKTSPSTSGSTEHELVAILADDGVAEPLKNLLLNLPGTSSANSPKQKEDKVSAFQKAANKKSSQSSSSSKAASGDTKEAGTLGALIAMLPPKDPETGVLYTYSLVSNAGGRFRLKDNELRINNETLFESQDNISHTIVVGRLDGKGIYTEKSFVLNFTKSQVDARKVSKKPA